MYRILTESLLSSAVVCIAPVIILLISCYLLFYINISIHHLFLTLIFVCTRSVSGDELSVRSTSLESHYLIIYIYVYIYIYIYIYIYSPRDSNVKFYVNFY